MKFSHSHIVIKEWANFDKLPEALGMTTSPDDCYLVLRGMRTLDIRMKAHEKSSDEIVSYLQTKPQIKTIFYPKLKSHPNHEIFIRDHKGTNGMITIEFINSISKEKIIKFVNNLHLFSIGASWGGYESLATVTTPPRTIDNLINRGVFVRFHIGLEDTQDLIDDLEQAFQLLSK